MKLLHTLRTLKFTPNTVPLRDAVVLITGGGSGIGRLMALEASRRGARAVVIWDLNLEAASNVVDELAGEGAAFAVDVTDSTSVNDTAETVLGIYGRVDVLINNAGIVTGKKFLDQSDDDVERTFAVNTLSHYRVTRAFLPGMIEQDRGSVVTIASAAGLVGVSRQTDYSASKFAAVGFAESLRAELRHEGSRVHTLLVCPYYISTGMFDGVKTKFPLLLPIMKPKHVAQIVIAAIEDGRQSLVLPPFVRLAQLLKPLPVPVLDGALSFFGINQTMDEFRGRKS